MKMWGALMTSLLLGAAVGLAQDPLPAKPAIGKVEIIKVSEIKPGMKGYAWTVFEGTEPEPIPVDILGVYKNAGGPRQDIILAKLGGKAARTNVAGGMSGSPVYIDGRLAGAISTRISVLSPDAICGITPIELMMEISDFDESRPAESRAAADSSVLPVPAAGGVAANNPLGIRLMTPIETPLTFSGFHEHVLRELGPLFQQAGLTVGQGGASGSLRGARPAPGWRDSLRPGEVVTAVLVSGDMTISAMGTVTYNDGRRVLAFGHSLLNLGRVNLPISKGEVLMTLASSLQPNKFANATEIVGSLKQDRRNGVLGVLGEEAEMIPVTVAVRSFSSDGAIRSTKTYEYDVCVMEKWTPTLLMTTLYNTISGINEFGEETTFRLAGSFELEGGRNLSLSTIQAPSDAPSPAPLLLANWFTDRFNRLFSNAVTPPRFRRVNVTVDLIPERRAATIESAWVESTQAEAGKSIPLKFFLRPYRGPRLEQQIELALPDGLPKGEYRILLSDADTLNRIQSAAGRANRFIDLDRSISLISQERTNNNVYVSVLSANSTLYYDDKILPSLPPSVLNVMQAGPSANRSMIAARETIVSQLAIPFDYMISGSYSLTITIK